MEKSILEEIIKSRILKEKNAIDDLNDEFKIRNSYRKILKEIAQELFGKIKDYNELISKYYDELILSMHTENIGIHNLKTNEEISENSLNNLIITISDKNSKIYSPYYNLIRNNDFYAIHIVRKPGSNMYLNNFFTMKYQFFDGSTNIIEANNFETELDEIDIEKIKNKIRFTFYEFLKAYFERSERGRNNDYRMEQQ
jgi:hypothetical protein